MILINHRDESVYMQCQYFITPRHNLVAVHLEGSDMALIYICHLHIYDLYRVPPDFIWRYDWIITIRTTQ